MLEHPQTTFSKPFWLKSYNIFKVNNIYAIEEAEVRQESNKEIYGDQDKKQAVMNKVGKGPQKLGTRYLEKLLFFR